MQRPLHKLPGTAETYCFYQTPIGLNLNGTRMYVSIVRYRRYDTQAFCALTPPNTAYMGIRTVMRTCACVAYMSYVRTRVYGEYVIGSMNAVLCSMAVH